MYVRTYLDVEQHGLGGGRVAEVLEDGDEVVQVVPVHGADVVEALKSVGIMWDEVPVYISVWSLWCG